MSEVIASADPTPTIEIEAKNPALTRRTAVLAVHGIGSQRVLDTVRGIVAAAWLDKDDKPGPGDKRYWLHPERKSDDLDLAVITTNEVPGTADHRSVDFHELYWAHLMSETRAVAVLLWLFELVRKGPRLKPGMRALWWGVTIFLCLLVQSVVLLGLHAILLLLGNPPLISDNQILFGLLNPPNAIKLANHWYHEPEALLLAPFFVLFMAATCATLFSAIGGAWKIVIWAAVLAVLSGLFFYFGINQPALAKFTSLFLPVVAAFCVVGIAMGGWGLGGMFLTYILSSLFFLLYLKARYLIDSEGALFARIWDSGWILWSLNERYSAVIAFAIILIYLALYVLFLQPFLGDAARYFRASPGNVAVRREIRRQAVDMLDTLHKWGNYDRIIIVAHSLGTVVAYDMLRAYFSRINSSLPDSVLLEPEFSQVDKHDPDNPSGAIMNEDDFRAAAREIVRKIAAQTINSSIPSYQKRPAWLVTDFVTLGSPLTHARYLMCDGNTEQELNENFERRVLQREFPVCPPAKQGDDGLLSFHNGQTHRREFQHAALFGLTRWTNLFFPMSQMFWGDAIGGPLQGTFGRYIRDVPVSTLTDGKPDFFTHTSYWKINGPMGRHSPQIVTLRKAINLEDQPR
jgi:hypothetical protein